MLFGTASLYLIVFALLLRVFWLSGRLCSDSGGSMYVFGFVLCLLCACFVCLLVCGIAWYVRASLYALGLFVTCCCVSGAWFLCLVFMFVLCAFPPVSLGLRRAPTSFLLRSPITMFRGCVCPPPLSAVLALRVACTPCMSFVDCLHFLSDIYFGSSRHFLDIS